NEENYPFFKEVRKFLGDNLHSLELVKTLIYTGEYNQKVLLNAKRNCASKIKEMSELIAKENLLLKKVSEIKDHDELRGEVTVHVNSIKEVFQRVKDKNILVIAQQSKKSEGQKKFFNYVKNTIPLTEFRTTPLVTRQGIIQQKGVDAKFSTDLLVLAQSNAFDVAILLTGDADMKENIKLIRERYGKLVFIVAYLSPVPEEKRFNTISEDLLGECDCFFNLYNLDESDIAQISGLRREKTE
ncbi:NYN domain-containing protein, partial [Candidatus Pacearchaeota archaeon]|nr:NYN domain-containing protein [Candidatus Pacearchaeota archaeon]